MRRTKLRFPGELLTSIDIMNTLNGGASQPLVRFEKFQTYHQIMLKVPGLSLDQVNVEINNNQLMIYYLTPVVSQEREVQFPKVLYNDSIPYFVDVNNIAAREEGAALIVKLPFNKFADGYHRTVKTG